MKLSNNDVRNAIKEANVLYWRVAEEIGITDGSFSRMLRKELPEEKKEKIYQAIEKIRAEEE